jgi:hypothetical protein
MILLTSTEYIKAHSGLNDNTYDKMIVPALTRAQDLDLTECLGECLVASLQTKVGDGTISDSGNTLYKVLLDNYVQPFLCYTTIGNLTLEIGQVMGNGGIDTVTDEHRQSLSFDERGQIKDYWLHHADAYRQRMQKFLKNNRSAFPELSGCGSCDEGANLQSAAGPSIWLGGARGRIINNDCCR